MKHISFDLWNTLIFPNPEFKKKRLTYLKSELSMDSYRIESIYRNIKDGADFRAEKDGICVPNNVLYKKFLLSLGRSNIKWLTIRDNMEDIFCKNPPYISPEIIDLLRDINKKFTLSIASNTNFIRGEILNIAVLEKLKKFGVEWSFKMFSDTMNIPKPNIYFWLNVIKCAKVDPSEILHIGDNKICDGGCREVGIKFEHVNDQNDLFAILSRLKY